MRKAEDQFRRLRDIRYASHVQREVTQTQVKFQRPLLEIHQKKEAHPVSSQSEWLDVLYVLGVPTATNSSMWALHIGKPISSDTASKLSDILMMLASIFRVDPQFFSKKTNIDDMRDLLLHECHIPWQNVQAINSQLPNFLQNKKLPSGLGMQVVKVNESIGNVKFKVQVDNNDLIKLKENVKTLREDLFGFFKRERRFRMMTNSVLLEAPKNRAGSISFYADIDPDKGKEEEQS